MCILHDSNQHRVRLQHKQDTNDEGHEIASVESELQEATELFKLIHTESAGRFERRLSRELTPDEVSVSFRPLPVLLLSC